MVAAAPAGLLERIDDLKLHIDELESELAQASRVAEAAAKRSRRLGERTQQLQSYAIQHVYEGDEGPARAALQQKAAAAEALAKANDRARLNCLLAAKLEQVGADGCGAFQRMFAAVCFHPPDRATWHWLQTVCKTACCTCESRCFRSMQQQGRGTLADAMYACHGHSSEQAI